MSQRGRAAPGQGFTSNYVLTKSHEEHVRLLLPTLQFANVRVLTRKEPQRKRVGSGFHSLRKVLPKVRDRDGQGVITTIQGRDRRRPQTGSLIPAIAQPVTAKTNRHDVIPVEMIVALPVLTAA